jgi:steroid 5-alpha reductase family enzyme
MDKGLWRYSRHPNYFGEMVQWWSIGVIALQVSYGWIGLLGPLTLTYLLLFVSGVPMIENRRKDDPAYRRYMQRTSMLIPLPPKKQ